MTTPSSKVAIVGAGVFGLSTALHLAKRGYKDVTVFDYQPYAENAYDPSAGCDGASADVNKIYRCSYGDEVEYQDLAFSGRPIWEAWNADIAAAGPGELPKGVTNETVLFVPCGFMRLSTGPQLSDYDAACLAYLERAGVRADNHVLSDAGDMARLAAREARAGGNWARKLAPFRAYRAGTLDGFVDVSAGLTYADKACAWARHLCEKAGVKFVLGPQVGNFDGLVTAGEGEGRKVTALRTADGKEHKADVVVVAAGGWTPSVVPEVAGLLETTAGSVTTIQLPADRKDLWDKVSRGRAWDSTVQDVEGLRQYSPDNFPAWAYGLTGHNSPEYGGFYGFPRTPEGKIKIGYRGRKWTNYQTDPKTGARLSVPKTKYTADKQTNLPKKAITHLKGVIVELFPDLAALGISDTRMCWYTDSVDNSFVVSYVPGYGDTLFVASGGSGHGFKFLPVLGAHVANALERTRDQFTDLWAWRSAQDDAHRNGLEEGEFGGRNLADLEMATEADWVFAPADRPAEADAAIKVAEASEDVPAPCQPDAPSDAKGVVDTAKAGVATLVERVQQVLSVSS
ncbi:hypothetical protein Q5752_004214 [Cryptotrichosporon argae]